MNRKYRIIQPIMTQKKPSRIAVGETERLLNVHHQMGYDLANVLPDGSMILERKRKVKKVPK